MDAAYSRNSISQVDEAYPKILEDAIRSDEYHCERNLFYSLRECKITLVPKNNSKIGKFASRAEWVGIRSK